MPIKVQSHVNYDALYKEFGVTLEELLTFAKNKDKYSTDSIKKVSLNQVIDEYIENMRKLEKLNRRSDNTLSTYLNFLDRVRTFVNDRNPSLTVCELNEGMVLDLLEKSKPKKGEKLSTNTVNKYMAIIRSILGFAFLQGYTEKDLRYKFSLYSSSTLPRYLNDIQVEQVLNGALQKTYGYRKRAMLLFLLGTGCRVSELTNIRVCDFIVNEDLIFIRKGKGNKERFIPIFKEVKVAVLHYLKLTGVPEWSPELKGYLFCQDEGQIREKKVLERSVQLLVRGLFDSIGLDRDFTVHSFRHTFAVRCLKAGIKEQHLMQMLGHEDPKTTAIYTKLVPKDLKEEVMKHYPFPFENLLVDFM
jgi:site-specific recombinase XerD